MNQSKRNILQRALQNPKSEIYLSKKWTKIQKYLWKKGIEVTKTDILNYLETNKST